MSIVNKKNPLMITQESPTYCAIGSIFLKKVRHSAPAHKIPTQQTHFVNQNAYQRYRDSNGNYGYQKYGQR